MIEYGVRVLEHWPETEYTHYGYHTTREQAEASVRTLLDRLYPEQWGRNSSGQYIRKDSRPGDYCVAVIDEDETDIEYWLDELRSLYREINHCWDMINHLKGRS